MLTSLTKCSITFPVFGKTISTHRTNSQQKQQQHDLDFFFRKGADPSQEGVRSQQLRGRQPLPPSTAPPVGGYLTKTVDFFGLLIMMRKSFVSQLLFGWWHWTSFAKWAEDHDCLLLNWAPAETQRAQARCQTESFTFFLSIGHVPAFLSRLLDSKGKLSPFVLHFHNYCLWAAPAA